MIFTTHWGFPIQVIREKSLRKPKHFRWVVSGGFWGKICEVARLNVQGRVLSRWKHGNSADFVSSFHLNSTKYECSKSKGQGPHITLNVILFYRENLSCKHLNCYLSMISWWLSCRKLALWWWVKTCQQPPKWLDYFSTWLILCVQGGYSNGLTKKPTCWLLEPRAQPINNIHQWIHQTLTKPLNYISIQDGAPKIARLPYKWFNYGSW